MQKKELSSTAAYINSYFIVAYAMNTKAIQEALKIDYQYLSSIVAGPIAAADLQRFLNTTDVCMRALKANDLICPDCFYAAHKYFTDAVKTYKKAAKQLIKDRGKKTPKVIEYFKEAGRHMDNFKAEMMSNTERSDEKLQSQKPGLSAAKKHLKLMH